MTDQKRVLCSSCDIYCQVVAEVSANGATRIKATDNAPFRANICMKGVHAPEGFLHPDRVRFPLRRVGERGSGRWERVTWDHALNDIAARLSAVTEKYGPEGFAVSASPWNVQSDSGVGRRFMNLLGNPNWMSGVALCAGNTAAINRMVYGWFPYPDYPKTKCIVLFGHNPRKHSWTPVYNSIRTAQQRGAKLIVLDPRRSENAELADIWLPLRAGTDAAMCMGWLKVIIDEGLYDQDFVAQWTTGFEELRARVNEFPLERVAEITGVAADRIAAAARMYATTTPGVIPWTPITDQQRNSTSAIRLHCTLRALTGNLDVPGGEVLHGFHPDIISESEIELHDELSEVQKAKQLGSQKHPAFTYRGMQALREPTKRVWGKEYVNLISGSYMANPSAVFTAMADGIPYPVKAFFTLGNNTLMSFANLQLIYRALMNQELVVSFEHMMTPTSQLADYVLPSDSWLERASLSDGFGWTSIVRPSQKVMDPPDECRNVYDFWRGLATRVGIADKFPWKNSEELLDFRVAALGLNFSQFAEKHPYHMRKLGFKKYETTGFATPSGKVELKSTVLESLGFDPLPYYRGEPPQDPAFPFMAFTGVREDEFFQTGHRHIASLRSRRPEPEIFLHPNDAAAIGVAGGEWIEVSTIQGRCNGRTAIRDDMPEGLVRVPHGWWKPEMPKGKKELSGAWEFADAQICPDNDDCLDIEQGIPHLKGLPCAVRKLPSRPESDRVTQRALPEIVTAE
jgi:anaerobic selenocysteine-containing dehydrogenase